MLMSASHAVSGPIVLVAGALQVIINSPKDKGKVIQKYIIKDIGPCGFKARIFHKSFGLCLNTLSQEQLMQYKKLKPIRYSNADWYRPQNNFSLLFSTMRLCMLQAPQLPQSNLFQKTRIAKISRCTSDNNPVVYTVQCVSVDSVVVGFKEGLGDIGLVYLQGY